MFIYLIFYYINDELYIKNDKINRFIFFNLKLNYIDFFNIQKDKRIKTVQGFSFRDLPIIMLYPILEVVWVYCFSLQENDYSAATLF